MSSDAGRLDSGHGYDVDPWQLRWSGADFNMLGRTESLFALSNGHIGLRGTLEEGEPVRAAGHLPQRLLRSAPLPYAEAGTATRNPARRS